jgi:hypothetical protein
MVVGGRGRREKEEKIVDGDWQSCFMVADYSGWWWSALVGLTSKKPDALRKGCFSVPSL